MEGNKWSLWLPSAILFQIVSVILTAVYVHGASVPALYVFGDSTVDCGTNNYINTTQAFRGNFPPYGKDFFKNPTGRFSNGRVIVDFIVEYAGKPLIPPFLEPNADLSHGANFGSGGAGVLVETNEGHVVDLQTQLRQFLHHKAEVTEKSGQAFAEELFSDAVYIVSIGSNDYLGGYFGNPKQQEKYTPEQFVRAVATSIVESIKILYSSGARKIVVFDLGPMGCLPALRDLEETRSCSAPVSAVAAAHNDAVKGALSQLGQFLPGLTIVTTNFYKFFSERLENPSQYGYVSVDEPCCGAGPCEGRCGVHEGHPSKPECQHCSDANTYVWWDPYHPSETVHHQFAQTVWNGTSPYIEPVAMLHLFKQKAEAHGNYADKLDLFVGDPLQQLVSESMLMT
ncbi:GDSL lipase isoform X3 [Physcomitrium patens]|nr:GDSL esterase/lipase 1-like isoform X3 [Physcomitrium patens]XP_024388815.1 GDSL esterase/lipase 1-like isoform X3 [Physcomitrium patens]XP_024388816.1 GDSL esterase/lipase 1-like isoform X3 [Physcomitrium patens]PNR45803.1 hypothetical protein PHYPA_015574 [Physcomitrium patens]|eukprot:XP_024388814.1 GDSL esterase/lipase 1-like isoform X3 [Physcomitrella patens]